MSKIFHRLFHIDSIISILLIALAVWVYWYAGFLITEKTKPISAHTFPRALAILLACSSILLLMITYTQQIEQSSDVSHRISGISPNLFVILMLITLVIYTVLLPVTGFIITSLFVFVLWLWMLGVRHYGVLIGFSVGVVAIVHILFQSILNVPLPIMDLYFYLRTY
jgi:hypothetical protein